MNSRSQLSKRIFTFESTVCVHPFLFVPLPWPAEHSTAEEWKKKQFWSPLPRAEFGPAQERRSGRRKPRREKVLRFVATSGIRCSYSSRRFLKATSGKFGWSKNHSCSWRFYLLSLARSVQKGARMLPAASCGAVQSAWLAPSVPTCSGRIQSLYGAVLHRPSPNLPRKDGASSTRCRRLRTCRIQAIGGGAGNQSTFLSYEEAGLIEMSKLDMHERFLCRLTVSSLNLLRIISEQEGVPIEALNAGVICDWFQKDKAKREQDINSATLKWDSGPEW